MGAHLQKVFNTYNVNILFTTHPLPAKVNLNHFNPAQMQAMQQKQQQLMQAQNPDGAMVPGQPA